MDSNQLSSWREKVLLVIDIDHRNFGSRERINRDQERQQVAVSLVRRIAWARSKKVPVVFIMDDSPGNELAEFLNNEREPFLEPIFIKTQYNAFSNPELARHLHSIDAKELLIVGCYSFICVVETAQGAIRAGFNVALLKDAIYPPFSSSNDEKLWICRAIECVPPENKISVTIK